MNIKYHAAIGITFELIFPRNGLLFLLSVAPDATLIRNELKLWVNSQKFDPEKVSKIDVLLYRCAHSLIVPFVLFWFDPICSLVYFVHIACDVPTHTGLFAARPFFPLPWVYKHGKEILK